MYSGSEKLRSKNPRQTANLLSFLTFGYTIELFRKGFKGHIYDSDVYEVPKSCSSRICGDKIEKKWIHCKKALKLLIRTFGKKFFLYTSIHLTWHLINSTVNPYALSRFISYFEKNQTHLSKSDAIYYGALMISFSYFRCLWIHNYFVLECTLGIQIRSGLTALIYRKVLRLCPQEVKNKCTGNVVTVLTKDIRTVETTIWPLSDMIIGTVKFFYLTYLLHGKLGNLAFLPMGVMLLVIILQAFLSKFVLGLRLKAGKMTDMRLNITREVLTVLKTIKMHAWENYFYRKVCQARKKETKANLRGWFLGTSVMAFGMLFSKLLFPTFLMIYISLGYQANIELVYYLMSIFKDFAVVMGTTMPDGFALSAEFYAAITRIGRVLNLPESLPILSSGNSDSHNNPISNDANQMKIIFKKVTISISGTSILKDISFCIDRPGLYMISGPLGSGKSSILKVILQEYPAPKGELQISGSLSYASQDPWLFPGTVQQNILFGQVFDKERYDRVVEVCSLEHDFRFLPQSDKTIVLDGGLNLSKGQQARINLARAVYKQCDIYLLDDPLACLDVRVQDLIFWNCIQNFLKDKIVIMITQNDRHLRKALSVIVLEQGQIIFLKEINNFNSLTKNSCVNECLSGTQIDDTKKEYEALNEKEQIKIYQESTNIGRVDVENYYRYIKYGGGILIFIALVGTFFVAQFMESYTDKLLSQWVDFQQGSNTSHNHTESTTLSQNPNKTLLRDKIFDLFLVMSLVSAVVTLIKSYWFLVYCRRASITLHKLMSQSVINTVMSFLDNHFIGNILNRFSYDLDHIDEVFPFLLKNVITAFFAIGGTLILIVSVDLVFLLMSFVFLITMTVIYILYTPTARALKRIVALTRSPFIGHLNATVEGLSTVKAFKAENLLKQEFDKHQDLAISAVYMETTTSIAFGYALDFDCTTFVMLIVLTVLILDLDISAGNVGLVLTQSFELVANLNWIIRAWALLEQCMTSVERVLEYVEIPQERLYGKSIPNWPKKGKITFREVSLIYNFETKILNSINFTIEPREKVAIIGRTGAGKSSIVSSLFRLYEYQGSILIDDEDIKNVSLKVLRNNMSLIPQDPLTFAASVRENLDPLDNFLDSDIWKVLKEVDLHLIINDLDLNINELNLSTGQKQLLCVARALLKNNRIVVMDEPTANLDAYTDKLVHQLVEQHFTDCTLLMIAHRLHYTLTFDKVMVLKNGRIAEFASPQELLKNPESLFSQMVNADDFEIDM